MDAEFLARSGASVISSDVSAGASRRALARARKYLLPIDVVVADAERLPFADSSVDLVYVHDGLHHLDDPLLGVTEMARVARRAVAITEPARAALTHLAVRLGLALEREDAGNHVARLDLESVMRVLRQEGFQVVAAERYGMYYRHEPGRAVRLLSRQPLFVPTRALLRAANAAGGRVGNKLTIQAVRETQ